MTRRKLLELTRKAQAYAKQYPQAVTLSWVDGRAATYDAEKAVCLCQCRRSAACIIGATAGDKALEDLLNQLIDFDDEET